jgi:lysine 2,3-aminomutase
VPADLEPVLRVFPASITPHYASLIDPTDPADPIARQCLPDPRELETHPWLEDDPLAEETHQPVPGLVHRYPDRALLLVTTRCAVYCRHCTRKRLAGRPSLGTVLEHLSAALDYLGQHPEIQEVLVSGGDPLLLPDEVLASLLKQLDALPSLRWLRLATRVPVVLPSRITPALCGHLAALAKPLYLNTQFNHPRELAPAALEGLARLRRCGVILANQAVLLRGVNDSLPVLVALFNGLLAAGVRPYYLFQGDLVQGTEHLRTDPALGLALMDRLSEELGGMGLPRFAVDLQGARGKLTLWPGGHVQLTPAEALIEAPDGRVFRYPRPR